MPLLPLRTGAACRRRPALLGAGRRPARSAAACPGQPGAAWVPALAVQAVYAAAPTSFAAWRRVQGMPAAFAPVLRVSAVLTVGNRAPACRAAWRCVGCRRQLRRCGNGAAGAAGCCSGAAGLVSSATGTAGASTVAVPQQLSVSTLPCGPGRLGRRRFFLVGPSSSGIVGFYLLLCINSRALILQARRSSSSMRRNCLPAAISRSLCVALIRSASLRMTPVFGSIPLKLFQPYLCRSLPVSTIDAVSLTLVMLSLRLGNAR